MLVVALGISIVCNDVQSLKAYLPMVLQLFGIRTTVTVRVASDVRDSLNAKSPMLVIPSSMVMLLIETSLSIQGAPSWYEKFFMAPLPVIERLPLRSSSQFTLLPQDPLSRMRLLAAEAAGTMAQQMIIAAVIIMDKNLFFIMLLPLLIILNLTLFCKLLS